jgi:hypothetical protein
MRRRLNGIQFHMMSLYFACEDSFDSPLLNGIGQNAANCPGQLAEKKCLLGNNLKKAWVNFDWNWNGTAKFLLLNGNGENIHYI